MLDGWNGGWTSGGGLWSHSLLLKYDCALFCVLGKFSVVLIGINLHLKWESSLCSYGVGSKPAVFSLILIGINLNSNWGSFYVLFGFKTCVLN